MICKQCGYKNDTDNEFCNQCGASLQEKEASGGASGENIDFDDIFFR